MPDRLEEIDKPDNDSPSTSHNDKKRPLVLNLENLYDISSELSSQGQILSQVVQDIQLHHKVCIPCPVQLRRKFVSTGAAGARTRRSLGHHLLHPLILRLLVPCTPAVLRPRALQDAPAPADPNS